VTNDERWQYLVALDEEVLKGGVILSEWCCFIVRETDVACASGANLASILPVVSGIETYLKSEYSVTGKERLIDLINLASIDDGLKDDLHTLRKYRNKWVHIYEPLDDEKLLLRSDDSEFELLQMAFLAARTLRRTTYESQWV